MQQAITLLILVGTTLTQANIWTSSSASTASQIVVNGQVVKDAARGVAEQTENGKRLRRVREACEFGKCLAAAEGMNANDELVGSHGVIQAFLQHGFN